LKGIANHSKSEPEPPPFLFRELALVPDSEKPVVGTVWMGWGESDQKVR